MSTYQRNSAALHIITGNLGDDPIQPATQRNIPMTVFSVAVNRKVGEEQQTTWYRIKTFGALAEACLAYLYTGRLVQVVGHQMSVWAYTDAKTGQPRARLELVATSVIFLDPPNPAYLAVHGLPDGDIPFAPVPAEAAEPVPA